MSEEEQAASYKVIGSTSYYHVDFLDKLGA
jgi:hypothetical protein